MSDDPRFPERAQFGCVNCGSTNHTTGDTNWCPVEQERLASGDLNEQWRLDYNTQTQRTRPPLPDVPPLTSEPPRILVYALELLVDDYGLETVRAALDEIGRWNDPDHPEYQSPTWGAP